MTKNQIEALEILKAATRGSMDPWDMAGPAHAANRARIMSTLLEKRVPISKSGVIALRFRLRRLHMPPGDCEAIRAEAFAAWAEAALSQSED